MAKKSDEKNDKNVLENRYLELKLKNVLTKDEKKEMNDLFGELAKIDTFYSAEQYLEKQYGDDLVEHIDEVERIRTDVIEWDRAFGGGLVGGRIYEYFGLESSGKSTATLHDIKNAQIQFPDKVAVYIDYEHSFDRNYAMRIGIDLSPKRFKILYPMYLEQGMEAAEKYALSGRVSIIVFDSVAAMVPKSEFEGEMEDQQMGAMARALGRAFRKLTGALGKNNVIAIFINQVRDKIGGHGGKTTPGGRALKFFASARFEFKKVEAKETYIRVGVKVVKSKLGGVFREFFFDINENGIMIESQILDNIVALKLVEEKTGWFTFGKLKKIQGRENALRFLRGNQVFLNAAIKSIGPKLDELDKKKQEDEFNKIKKLSINFEGIDENITLDDLLNGTAKSVEIDDSMLIEGEIDETESALSLKGKTKFDVNMMTDEE